MSRLRLPAVLVLAYALCAVATVRLGLDDFRLLPGDHQGPLPLAFWSVTAIYGLGLGAVLRLPWRRALLLAAGCGLPLHLWLLLTAAGLQAARDPGFFDNPVYFWYFRAVFLGASALLAIFCGALSRRLLQGRWRLEWTLAPLLLALAATLVEMLACGDPAELASAVVLAIGAVAGWRWSGAVWSAPALALAWLEARPGRSQAVFLLLVGMLTFALVFAANANLVRSLGSQFPLASDDGDWYDLYAGKMATGQPIPDRGAVETTWYYRPPGYPFMVAWTYWLFGHRYLAIGLVQGLVGAVVACLTYWLGKLCWSPAVGALAALLVALSGTINSVLSTLRSEGLYILLSTAFVLTLVLYSRAVPSPKSQVPSPPRPGPGRVGRPWTFDLRLGTSLGWLALTGVVLGFAEITKPQTMGFVPFVLLWLLLFRPAGGASRLRRCLYGLWLLLWLAGSMAPTLARDVAVNGRVSILTSGGNPAWMNTPMGVRLARLGISPDDGLGSSMIAVPRHPGETASIVAEELPAKVAWFFFGGWYGKADPFLLQRFSGYAQALRLYGYLAVAGAGISALRHWRDRGAERGLILAYLAITSGSIILLAVPTVRYRIPLEPLLLLLEAQGIVLFVQAVRRAYVERSPGAVLTGPAGASSEPAPVLMAGAR